MRIAISRPSYLPWLGFFDQLRQCDAIVLDDDHPFARHAWSARARIKAPGSPEWLAVPVLTDSHRRCTHRDVRVAPDARWPARHLEHLRRAYARSLYFDELYAALEPILTESWLFLLDMQVELLRALAGRIGLEGDLVCASSLHIDGPAHERHVRICRHLGATCLLTGASVHGRFDDAPFADAGIRVERHRYVHPRYSQLYGEFVPYLSVVDLLFNEGPNAARILAGTEPDRTVRAA